MKHLRIFHGLLAVVGIGLFSNPLTAQEPVRTMEDVRKLESKITSLAEKALPATVALISVETGASGSGVITTADGLILTAAHVVDGNEQVEVVFPNGRETKAKVLGINLSKDIALAKIEEAGPWPFVEMGHSRDLKAGDWVVAMGHSAGYDPTRTPPVRFGRVVSQGPGNFLTSDCSLIGGDSGGPLYGVDGKVVAVNSSIGESIKNNNHAGVDGFREDWDRLMKGDKWGELQMNPLANQERPVMGIRVAPEQKVEGAITVESVTVGTPAARAGIEAGDLIKTINGSGVRAGRAFFMQIAKYRAGDTLKVGLTRGSKDLTLDVKLVQAAQIGQKAAIAQKLNFDVDKTDVPLMTMEEEQATQAESKQLYDTIRPATKRASESTVWVWGLNERDQPVQLAEGTVIGDGHQVLTKWSEVILYTDSLSVVSGNGTTAVVKVAGVYKDHDLAVLDIKGQNAFTPIAWDNSDGLRLGRILVAAAPGDRKPNLGVVAVEARSLRNQDQAFLGVELDGNFSGPGVKIRGLEDHGAAKAAGLVAGDIIRKVGTKEVNSAYEMRTSLNGHGPGEHIEIFYEREGKPANLDLALTERPEFQKQTNARLETMRRMGTKVSTVFSNFPSAVQSDMSLEGNSCGGPIVDLDGKVVGISIARADRTASLLIPSNTVVALLRGDTVSADSVKADLAAKKNATKDDSGIVLPQGGGPGAPGGRAQGMDAVPQNSAESLRQNLQDMEQMLDRLKREMADIGE